MTPPHPTSSSAEPTVGSTLRLPSAANASQPGSPAGGADQAPGDKAERVVKMPGASGALNQEFAVSRRERRRDAAEVALSDSLSELVAGRGVVIHDRLLPNGHTIIDHIAVTGAGVFVISVEPMRGKLELRNVGKRRKPDQRLFVAGEDRTLLVAETRHCAGAVRLAVDPGGTGSVPIRRILCFVNTTWERKATPLTLDGVHVTWADEVLEQLAKDGPLPKDRIGALGEAISTALPAAGG